MQLKMNACILIVCLFQVSLGACPVGEKLDDGGRCAKTCPEGTYVNTTNGCSECPSGYFMNQTEHTRTECNKCRWINPHHEANSIVLQNCTARSDLIFRCRGNYYIETVHSDVSEVTCSECIICSSWNLSEILPCNGVDDALCCGGEDMVAHTDAQGRRTCVQGTTTTAGTPSTISAAVRVRPVTESGFQITPEGPVLIVKANTGQEIVCNIRTSDTSTNVKWFPESILGTTRLEKVEVDVDNKYLFQTTIIFTNFEAQHKGNYTCKLTGDNFAESLSIFLDFISETKSEALFSFGNKTAELSCFIDHKYSSVVWLQNTTLISELKDKDRFVAQNSTLIINNPEHADGNKYIARFTLDVAPQNKPEIYDCEVKYFASPLVKDIEKSKNLIQHENLELQCQVLGYPPAAVTWYKDNDPLNATGSDRVLLFPLKGYKNAHLKIKNVDFNDAGDYKCEASSDHFNDSSAKVETVRVKESGFQITPKGPELIVKANNRQELVCNIRTSDTSTKVKWLPESIVSTIRLEKTEVDVDNKYLFQSTIIFTNFEAQHEGNYTCELSGDNFAESLTIFLDFITETKSEPLFGFGNKTAELSCTIDHKYSSVVWLQNTTLISELKDKDRFVAQNTTLIINNPERTDGNKYIARFTLDVAPHNKPETYDCEVEFFASPLVKDFEKSKNLIQEDNLELQCQVLGYPPAVVTWYKDNEPLNATGSDRVLLFPLKGYKNAHLKIKNVDFNDAGDYKCEAFSDHFNDSSAKEVTVRVKDKLAALWPFLGIVGEVVVLCTIIFIYEKRRNKQAEQEENNAQEADEGTPDKKDGLRHRNTVSNNTTA
ncbi:unnamed protein product [Lymnaea stagnalis]|uniref:Ig-like domain-containing protein n=1 Tax=Lymnaea stagnalis TaxID=6523 RepID=A0AAV2IAY4_LYMST